MWDTRDAFFEELRRSMERGGTGRFGLFVTGGGAVCPLEDGGGVTGSCGRGDGAIDAGAGGKIVSIWGAAGAGGATEGRVACSGETGEREVGNGGERGREGEVAREGEGEMTSLETF
jgi:hypothetical protein